MSWDKFCPSNLIELHIYDLPLRYRPNASRLRQILQLNRDILEVLELSGCISLDSDLTYTVTMSRVHTLKLAFNHIPELFCLFLAIQFPALSSLEVRNLIPQSTWFGRPPKDMQLAVTAVMERLTWALPLHQLKALRLDCIPFSSPSNEILTPVSLDFFKKLTSVTSLSLYSPNVITLKCMNRSPDILPALKALKISTPGANYYEHILSFRKKRARMPARKMLEHFELTLPTRAEEFVQREEVFAIAKRRVVLKYQLDVHPPDQDVEMVEDNSDLGDEETDESEGSGSDMDED
ncbi:hypothetical protein ARMGADRAFT_1090143 [Armillaria gallica]|uniref:F-box domain-containing protein n=1 Tax=Armillaria gallica TaxID=47427 RepID=A0A2H3D0Z8_ARMGA|nr:hypothetical protein ARMGADRAFT_1090143 [Armillaria gallica]